MLKFLCQHCGQKIKVQDDRLDRRVACPRCGVVQVVPAEAELVTDVAALDAYDDGESGQTGDARTIYLHQRPRRRTADGDPTTTSVVEHVEQHFGQVKTVLHELTSDRLNIDVQYIPPSRRRPFNVLVTLGMSAVAMSTPEQARGFEFAELLIVLPPDWPLTQEAFERDEHHWPVRTLLDLARRPHRANTWLSRGHVLPHGDPPRPYASDTEFCGAILLPPTLFGQSARQVEVQPGKLVHFLSVVPLHRAEMKRARKRGPEALIKHLAAANVNELLDPQRRSVATKRFRLF